MRVLTHTEAESCILFLELAPYGEISILHVCVRAHVGRTPTHMWSSREFTGGPPSKMNHVVCALGEFLRVLSGVRGARARES